MLFSSPAFFLFFGVYFFLHLLLPLRYRLALIIAGSAIFYGYWNPWYAWIPFAFVAIAHQGTMWVMGAPEGAPRRRRLAATIGVLLLPLAIVKYAAFVHNDVLGPILATGERMSPWPLPLGISFITFTLIAYVVDVHRGRYPLERNPAMLSGLVLFFPHLIAGPILRPAELLPQLRHPRRGVSPLALFAVALFTWGLVKKLVFADSIAESVDRVYAPGAAGLGGGDYLLAIYGFSVQIFCDFSGYTDMAIATALLLGVKLPANFHRPYTADSVATFWRRWHVTLSRWLRDYLYIPLGGNRRGKLRQASNLIVTMGLGGLWHGANWTFVLWGLAHGAGIALAHAVRRSRVLRPLAAIPRWLKIVITFHFVTVLWILFRAPDLATAWRVLRGPFTAPWHDSAQFMASNLFPLALIAVFLALHRWDSHGTLRWAVKRSPRAALVPILAAAWVLAVAISQGSSAKFIYFDF